MSAFPSDEMRAQVEGALRADACPHDPEDGFGYCDCPDMDREADIALDVIRPYVEARIRAERAAVLREAADHVFVAEEGGRVRVALGDVQRWLRSRADAEGATR